MSGMNNPFPKGGFRGIFNKLDPVGHTLANYKGANLDPYHLYTAPPEPDQPTPTPVTPMPGNDPSDLNIISARRRSIEEQMRRRGRMSTVLSNPQAEPLGG